MRICIHKATKRIIEMQSDATAGTLIQNAVNGGYLPADIEEKEVDEAGYEAAKAQDTIEIAAKAAQEDQAAVDGLVNQKMKDLAITELKKEGKLDADGKIPK